MGSTGCKATGPARGADRVTNGDRLQIKSHCVAACACGVMVIRVTRLLVRFTSRVAYGRMPALPLSPFMYRCGPNRGDSFVGKRAAIK